MQLSPLLTLPSCLLRVFSHGGAPWAVSCRQQECATGKGSVAAGHLLSQEGVFRGAPPNSGTLKHK